MRRRIVPTLVAVLATAVVALLVFGLASQGTSRALDNALAAGRLPGAPETTRSLPVVSGASRAHASLSQWAGKIIVINFWASWCPPCRSEVPFLGAAQRQLSASGAGTVVGITYNDAASDSLAFIHRHRITYPNLHDVDGSFASGYGTDQLPETFVLDSRMRVVALIRGEITSTSFLRAAIARAQRA